MPPTLRGVLSSASTGCFSSPLSGQLQLVCRSSRSSTTRGDLVTRRSRYVPNWVRVFYSAVYVDADRVAISFMLMGQQ
jgi:hypothetical protein